MIKQVLNNLLNNIDTAINSGETHTLSVLSSTYQRLKSVTTGNIEDQELLDKVLNKLLKAIDEFNIEKLNDLSKAYQNLVVFKLYNETNR